MNETCIVNAFTNINCYTEFHHKTNKLCLVYKLLQMIILFLRKFLICDLKNKKKKFAKNDDFFLVFYKMYRNDEIFCDF